MSLQCPEEKECEETSLIGVFFVLIWYCKLPVKSLESAEFTGAV